MTDPTRPGPAGPPVLAYDLVVAATSPPRTPAGPALRGGWAGPEGPAIATETWPRSPRTGQPLRHCVTVWLPPAHRPAPDLVAVSVFQWSDEGGPQQPTGGPAPEPGSWTSVTTHRDTSEIYATVFLGEAGLTGAHTVRPPLAGPLDPGEAYAEAELPPYAPTGPVWLVPRDDPNAGRAPGGPGYVDVPGRFDRFGAEHLGGTLMNANGSGAGALSASYLELNRVGGFSFGGDEDLAFDLRRPEPLGWTAS